MELSETTGWDSQENDDLGIFWQTKPHPTHLFFCYVFFVAVLFR